MHVLVVAPDGQHRRDVVRAFRVAHTRADITIAADDAEALEFLDGTGRFDGREPPHLVAAALPEPEGLRLLQAIKSDADHARLPVIMLSPDGGPEAINDAYRHGASCVVPLPARLEALAQYWSDVAIVPR